MADSAADRKATRSKSRQSIAHLPSAKASSFKDNVTTDVAALQAQHSAAQMGKKSRGKSLGPGGLEALKESDGNSIKVIATNVAKSPMLLTLPRPQLLSRSSQFSNPRYLSRRPKQFLPSTNCESEAQERADLQAKMAVKSSSLTSQPRGLAGKMEEKLHCLARRT